MQHSQKSLQYRLMASLLGVTAAAWLVVLALTWYETDHELNELLDAHLAQTASFLVVQVGKGHEAPEDFTAAPTLHKYQARVAFQVWHENKILFRSEKAPELPFRNDLQSGFTDQKMNGQTWRVFSTQGHAEDVWVHVAELLQFRQDILLVSLKSAIFPLLLIFPALAFFIWWSIRASLAPLRNLGQQIGMRKPSSLTPLAEGAGVQEVQPLVKALNHLFKRVERQMTNERQFTSDAAHELRTPIAAIRMQAQVALGATQPLAQQTALNDLLHGCDRATRLVSQLLDLSRLDAFAVNHSFTEVQSLDVVALTRLQLAEAGREWLQKKQTLSFDAPDNLALKINPEWLAVIVRNLVDNASRYSPVGASIKVSWVISPSPSLIIEDGGPGMSEADMQKLGDRFFRVLGDDATGCGLGWSIVKRIARICELQINLSKGQELGGLKVQVSWPTQAT
jgi:two-component system sensor histidine kinase QseC